MINHNKNATAKIKQNAIN